MWESILKERQLKKFENNVKLEKSVHIQESKP